MEMEKVCICKGEVKLEPSGNLRAGNEWSYTPKIAGGIKKIILRLDETIHSLTFEGISDGDHSAIFGGGDGDRTVKIKIDFPSEYFTGISGTYHSSAFDSLAFHTNGRVFGPFGFRSRNGTAFSVNANGGVVTGFHGRSCSYLRSIGVYVMPLCLLSTEAPKEKLTQTSSTTGVPLSILPPPRSAAAIGGAGCRDWDDGVFAAVKGVHVRVRTDTGVVSAVRFSYRKKDGSDFVSPFRGGSCGANKVRKTILFSEEEEEYLMGIEGFYGKVEGMEVIKLLSFITNKAKYGPIGTEMGMYFTSLNLNMNMNRKVVGFHGRSGAYLDAIGMHTEYL